MHGRVIAIRQHKRALCPHVSDCAGDVMSRDQVKSAPKACAAGRNTRTRARQGLVHKDRKHQACIVIALGLPEQCSNPVAVASTPALHRWPQSCSVLPERWLPGQLPGAEAGLHIRSVTFQTQH